MWKCRCGWTGENGDLKPAMVESGVQGMVRTSACPSCGEKVGDGVELVDPVEVKEVEDISQEVSEAEEEVISEAQPALSPTTEDVAEEGSGTGYEDTSPQEPATGYEDTETPAPSSVEESTTVKKKPPKKTAKK